ncbi:small ribosomal subunit protein uS15m [Cloeon dipterum]|uniref:small ribosomal subunit protein uS15m n=1 Tax=Cloeon dipterum TaxID=197152 RepID=UPI00321F93EC
MSVSLINLFKRVNFRETVNAPRRLTNLLELSQWSRGLKTVHLEWKRPEKLGSIHPKNSGDLEPLPELDKSEVFQEFKDAGIDIEKMSQEQRKLYTLGFLPAMYAHRTQLQNALSKVQRHQFDTDSIEAKIARATVNIRRLQNMLAQEPRNKKQKVFLKELIDKRKSMLNKLREADYKRFEWLIEQLNIEYRPQPENTARITRKNSLRMLTEEYCDKVKNDRLEALKKKMQVEKEKFEIEKKQILEWIEKEEAACEQLKQLISQ